MGEMSTKVALASLLSLLLLCAGCTGVERNTVVESNTVFFYGEDIIPAIAVENFTLIDSEGQDWNYHNQTEGKVVVIAFLFTNCIDICPIVTENLRWVHSQLSEEEHNGTQFLTITVDPWRDDTTALSEWKQYRNASWPHVTTNSTDEDSPAFEIIQSVWENFAVGLSIEETPENETNTSARHHPDAYSVNHSTGTVLVDSNGMQRVWWGDNDWLTDLVLADIQTLLKDDLN
jgi:protein SCO1/2